MTHVKLLGELGEKFGTDWKSGSSSLREIFKLIDCQYDGLQDYLVECANKGIGFTVKNGNDFLDDDLNDFILPILKDTVVITPVPAGSGKGIKKLIAAVFIMYGLFHLPGLGGAMTEGGTMGATTSSKTVELGSVQFASTGETISMTTDIAVSVGQERAAALTTSEALKYGASLNTAGYAVMGTGAMLGITGLTEYMMPDPGDQTSDPSFLFNGANSNIEQGQPVPVLYGTMKIGGSVLSQGFQSGEINNTTFDMQAGTALPSYIGSASGGTASSGGSSGGSGGGTAHR